MTQKDQVLVAVSLLEQRLALLGVPAVVIVGLTETAEFVRLSKGMDQPHNRDCLRAQFDLMIAEEEQKAFGQKPLFSLPRLKECPICLGGGRGLGDSELTAEPCAMCSGTGRVSA